MGRSRGRAALAAALAAAVTLPLAARAGAEPVDPPASTTAPLVLVPARGALSGPFAVQAPDGCPDPAASAYAVHLFGASLPQDGAVLVPATPLPAATGAYAVHLFGASLPQDGAVLVPATPLPAATGALDVQAVAAPAGDDVPAGAYVVELECLDPAGVVLGTASTGVDVTADGTYGTLPPSSSPSATVAPAASSAPAETAPADPAPLPAPPTGAPSPPDSPSPSDSPSPPDPTSPTDPSTTPAPADEPPAPASGDAPPVSATAAPAPSPQEPSAQPLPAAPSAPPAPAALVASPVSPSPSAASVPSPAVASSPAAPTDLAPVPSAPAVPPLGAVLRSPLLVPGASDAPPAEPGPVVVHRAAVAEQDAAADAPPAGVITITTPYTADHPLDLGTLELDPDGTRFVTTGDLDGIQVSDSRAGDLPWTLQAQAGDLRSGAAAINGQNVGLTGVTSTSVPDADGVVRTLTTTDVPAPASPVGPGDPGTDGLGGQPHVIAHAPQGSGTVSLAGRLTVEAPSSTPPGTYSGVITLTVVGG
ncbi:hypothetical protein EV189_0427 [Motilibacter rhizosphaerae]|uniref:Surface cell wall-binding protein n=1 Tax=Motilibacter rhizosphaerae TaxID=598652 RepID=A0A4Q7NVC0_9ACTN|nr:hypothetical protein [Motilibacter rhizosphaerae]RZS91193.1 hypothetical protein EV189_0427 [Motilibacter rhizosphaerae]